MKLHYFLTFAVIAISGNPAAPIFGKEGTYIVAFLILMFLWIRRPVSIEQTALILPAVIAGLALVHLFSFGPTVLMASLGFLIKIAIGILAATVIEDFFRKFVRLMAILACISLVFYIPYAIGIDLSGPLSFLRVSLETIQGPSMIRHIGIHNFHQEYETRNSGMFWEPGAFAGCLVLALFIVTASVGRWVFPRWEVSVLVIGLLSTQSTMGYIAGMVVATHFLFKKYICQRKSGLLPLAPIVLILGGLLVSVAFSELEFLGGKITDQFFSMQVGGSGYEITRFGNMLNDIDSIVQRPLVGWSGNPETRYAFDPELAEFLEGQGSALTGFWVRFGAIGWLALFFGFFAAANKSDKSSVNGVFMVVISAILLVGEQYTNYPLIYCFLVGFCTSPLPMSYSDFNDF